MVIKSDRVMVAKKYFPHDANARNDDRIVRLRVEHGAAGYGVYFMLLERLREESNYECECNYEILSYDFRVDASLVQSVVEDFGLFSLTEDGKSFYSDSFTKTVSAIDKSKTKRAEAGRKGMAKRWGNRQVANVTEPENKSPDIKPNGGEELEFGWEQPPSPKPSKPPKPKPQKHKYAPLVLMTEDEYNKLATAYGQEGAEWMITKLDNYKAARGMTYKSDYRAILNWVVKEYQKKSANERTTTYRQSDSAAAKQQRDAEFIGYISAKLGSDEVP